jgi:hypothetical protein
MNQIHEHMQIPRTSIHLTHIGALFLAAAVLTLGIGLIRAAGLIEG